jgi:transposase
MDVEQLRKDVREGRIKGDRLVDLVVMLARELQSAKEELEAARRQIEEFQRKHGGPAAKVEEPYSLRAEEQRQARRGKRRRPPQDPRRRGRITTAEKIARATRTEKVFPAGVPREFCRWSHTRPVWRLENGRAVLVAYEVYRGPKHRYGQIPGMLGRSEFGIEIVLSIAYQVYILGLSFDKACQLLCFFQGLKLRKSQADALLNQLSRHWEEQFNLLCTLLAHSAVVHADETSWSHRSVWAFLSEKVRVLFFGVPKDAATLREILDPTTFEGIVISDDAAVYANFTRSQKCWAHLLRKAIRMTLLEPGNKKYRRFTDRLLEIYRLACRMQRDRRLSDAGRARKAAGLEQQLCDLCWRAWFNEPPATEGAAKDHHLLVQELMRLMLAEQLFCFVTAAPVQTASGETMAVAGTNNEAERALRAVAEARKTGRTSKTLRGARRRTIVVSVLESLRRHLATFTLPCVIDEIRQWSDGRPSCFARMVKALGLISSRISPLDRLLPVPGG